jgi:two-component system, LytTR family, sensor kinase
MFLEMKTSCEKCRGALQANAQAYICSFECTYCPECALNLHSVCPHCGGELVRRPLRNATSVAAEPGRIRLPFNKPLLVWALSFGVWTIVALLLSVSSYLFSRSINTPASFVSSMGLQFSNILTFAPLTPFAFALTLRYPVQRNNWKRSSMVHLAGGLVFTVMHVALQGMTPYASWDPRVHAWVSAVGRSPGHAFQIHWSVLRSLFVASSADDIMFVYVPIVLIAHAVWYHQSLRERDISKSQLEAQLAKAHLRVLKSQLQPHFLFNTLHSISSLMLTDVPAADKMMTRLSDLLRMSLEDNETQLATLSRELEFVDAYLEIENIRFADRLSIVRDIAPDTLDAEVPHLLLQPLVENAVQHGISRLSFGGKIRISASHDGRNLYLAVTDNGPGLGNGDQPSSRAGLGLKATRERLKTLFGNDQTFELRTAAQGGVEACVRIPLRLHYIVNA